MSRVDLRLHSIFALNEPVRPVASADVLEAHVPTQSAEEWKSVAEEDGNSRDDETLNEPGIDS